MIIYNNAYFDALRDEARKAVSSKSTTLANICMAIGGHSYTSYNFMYAKKRKLHEIEAVKLVAYLQSIGYAKDFSKEINSIKKELENLNYLFKKNRISLKDYDREYDELELELKKLESVVVEEIDLNELYEYREL